jgi:uncharacterized protein YhaN
MKNSINQVENTVESITSRLEQTEERMSGIEDQTEEILLHSVIKKKISKHDHILQVI